MRCGVCGDRMASGRTCFRCAGAVHLGNRWLPPTLPFAEPTAEVATSSAPAALRQELPLDRRSRPRAASGADRLFGHEAQGEGATPAEPPRDEATRDGPRRADWASGWEDRWSEGLAAAYQEAAAQKPSGVLQACIDRLVGVGGRAVQPRPAVIDDPASIREAVPSSIDLDTSSSENRAASDDELPDLETFDGEMPDVESFDVENLDVHPDRWGMVRMQLAAGAVDVALLTALVAGVSWISGPGWVSFAFGGIAAFTYLTLSGFLGGRTLGDRVVGLQTLHRSGARPSLATAALRACVGVLGTAALFVGPLWSLFDAEGRTLHDRLAGTSTLPLG